MTLSINSNVSTVKLCFEGGSNNTPTISWHNNDTIGSVRQNPWKQTLWDHEWRAPSESRAWPELAHHDQSINYAYIGFGNLPQTICEELLASDPTSTTPAYIAPSELSFTYGPVRPITLDDGLPEDECYGEMELSISGMGYFSWQPLADYWKLGRRSAGLQKMLRMCRQIFPAPAPVDVDILKNRLGPLFLNCDEHQPGDWIVSVSEYG